MASELYRASYYVKRADPLNVFDDDEVGSATMRYVIHVYARGRTANDSRVEPRRLLLLAETTVSAEI
jgi:hypothetical protein